VRIPTLLFAAILIAAGAVAQAQEGGIRGFGLGSGRADPSDVATLSRDIAKVINAERLLKGNRRTGDRTTPPSAADIAALLGIERQKELLGVDGDVDLQALATLVREWWMNNVLQPTLDIASNPAASCTLAQGMLERIVSMERQAQVLGLDDAFGNFGDVHSPLGDAFMRVRTRCTEEAFDECMATGSGQALIMLATSTRRQMAMLNMIDDDWDARVAYLLRRCTVYKVIYNIALRDTESGESSVLDGSYILVLQLPEGTDLTTSLTQGRWRRRMQDPLDVQVTILTCGKDETCRQTEPFSGGLACGIITRRRNVTERTFTVVPVDSEHKPKSASDIDSGTVLEWREVKHQEGADRLVLQFLPPFFIIGHKFPEEIHYAWNGADTGLFMEAIQVGDVPPAAGDPCAVAPLLIDNDTWVEAGYPTLFRTAHSASHENATETSHFDIVHRPDLFPPDEINPNFEPKPRDPGPNRKPAQPSK
jgi:hypothetical protein